MNMPRIGRILRCNRLYRDGKIAPRCACESLGMFIGILSPRESHAEQVDRSGDGAIDVDELWAGPQDVESAKEV